MRSEKQIVASRANGARSRGPVTKEGKQRSSQNALRHGLLAKCVVLCSESRRDFEDTFQQYIERFQPVDEVEFTFVEEMAVNYWRLRRAWSIETKMFDQRIETMKPGDEMACVVRSLDDLAGAQTLTLLNRYETRIHCAFQRALRNLLLLRSHQEPNEPKDPAPNASNPERDPEQPRNPKPPSAFEQQPSGVMQPSETAAGHPAGLPPAKPQPATRPQSSPPEPNGPDLPNEPQTPPVHAIGPHPDPAPVGRPFEAAAGLPPGVPAPASPPAQQHAPATSNQPKPAPSSLEDSPDPDEPAYEFVTVFL